MASVLSQKYVRIIFTCVAIIVFNPSTDIVVNAKPQIRENQDWILPASRDETENKNTFKFPQILDALNKWWPFNSEKTFIPAINPNELLKRVGIVPKGDGEEGNWLIFENNENENVLENKENLESNENVDNTFLNTNRIEEWSNSIPEKIKKSIDSMKSDFFNATERVKHHFDKARDSLISNVKEVFKISNDDTKLPKESTNTNGVDFLEEKVFQPVTKFVDSLGIEEKLSKFYSKYFDQEKVPFKKSFGYP